MVTFWWERKTGAEITENIPPRVQERTKLSPFSTGRICSRAAALSHVSIAHHISKSDADKDASRE
jgi:hypothetical protein